MKKRHGVFFGFAVLLITAIFTLAGCPTDSDSESENNPFVGSWLSTANDQQYRKIIMKSDLTWEFHQSEVGDTDMDTKGTYTYTGKTASAIATHLYMTTGGGWVSTDGQPAEVITVTSKILTNGSLEVTAYDGTFTYTKSNP